MRSTSSTLLLSIRPVSYQMRLSRVALALVLVPPDIAQADASANATASLTPSRTFFSSGARPTTLLSKLPSAKDEERVKCIETLGWKDKLAVLLAKSYQVFQKQNAESLNELKVTWWSMENGNPQNIYTKLELDKVDKDILSNSKFHLWLTYVKNYNPEHPEKQVSIIEMLRAQYGDYKLAMILEEATSEAGASLKTIGTELQMEHMSYWKDQEISSIQLYEMLQVDKHNPTLLLDPEYSIWSLYFSKFVPGESMELFDQLYYTFGDKGLSSLLSSARQSEKTLKLAIYLQRRLGHDWLSKGTEPKLVFEHLLLDKNPNGLLDQYEVRIWLWYAKKFSEKYSEKTKTHMTLNEIIKNYDDADGIERIIDSETTLLGKKWAGELAAAQS